MQNPLKATLSLVVIPSEARDLQFLRRPKRLQIPRHLRSSE